jgi:adenylate cyclase
VAEQRVQIRLAAILAADVVGYSRLMVRDEAGTVARLKSLRAELFDPRTEQFGGRIFKNTGDGALAEFGSAVDAVQCAIEIQRALALRNADAPEDHRIILRIGISMGDVIVDGDDLYGNGVNVAARMEGLAEPGAICVSGNVYEHVGNSLDVELEDLGEQSVKNIDRPIRCYRVHLEPGGVAGTMPWQPDGTPSLPDKPSVAVLPFTNMSSDPEQEYFADGMTEDLITDLSKMSGLFVIARNSSFAFKGKSVDVTEIGQKLGVRHVLEGSVRRAGNRIRINAQLIDAGTGGHQWAERYDGDFDDIFALQDNITAKIISALEVHLTSADRKSADRKPTHSAEAYDLYLKGRSEYYFYAPDHLANAKQYLEKAIEIDPNYAEAYGYLSYCHTTAYLFMWPGADETLDRAIALAEKSVELNDTSAVAYTRLGWVQGYLGHFDEAIANFETAITLDPRNAEAFYAFGETMNRAGKPARALPLFEKAFGIDKIVPPSWDFAVGSAYLSMRRYDEALAKLLPVIERVPGFLPARVQLARAYSEMDRLADAKREVEAILEIAPKFTMKNAFRMFPYPNEEDRRRLLDGLRDAGLPE